MTTSSKRSAAQFDGQFPLTSTSVRGGPARFFAAHAVAAASHLRGRSDDRQSNERLTGQTIHR
jgi:hypothetical protein